ncbi:3-dehydroquinate synthase [Flavobacteriaceae bacterium TK19130]|nr:3-dehydroquinate synthase [Thermobacterium salinum]
MNNKQLISNGMPIYENERAWQAFEQHLSSKHYSSIFILMDTNTKRKCLPYFLQKSGLQNIEVMVIGAGETNKTIDTCVTVWNELSERGADRNSLLINVGGGVVTDLGGFVACTFRRGIDFINVPTSLLAMVDAAVGGKNGVDLGILKNQIGIIRPATMVLLDSDFLKTLPTREVLSGLAEMLKHGLITSEDYYRNVLKFSVNHPETEFDLIWKSVEIKNEVVTEDPLEHGRRKTLNFGHTLGHAIESHWLASKEKSELLHGEAVVVGMILALYISAEEVSFSREKRDEISLEFISLYDKITVLEEDRIAIIDLLKYDKKNRNGQVNFVLLRQFGDYEINCKVANTLIHDAFDYYSELRKN